MILPDANELYVEHSPEIVKAIAQSKALLNTPKNNHWTYKQPEIFTLPKILAQYVGSEILGVIGRNVKGEDVLSKFVKHFTTESSKVLHRKAFIELNRNVPFLAHRIGFMLGTSKIDAYYTAEINGRHVPLYIKAKGESELTLNQLQEIYKQVIKNTREYSGVNNQRLVELYNDDFSYLGAANRYLNGDLKKVEDLRPFYYGLSKLTLYQMVKYGGKTPLGTFKDDRGNVVRIVKHERASPILTWIDNEIGNVIYDFFDNTIYRLVEPFGPDAAQRFLQAEYKALLELLKPKGYMERDHYT